MSLVCDAFMTQESIPTAQNTYPLPQALTRLQDQPQVQNLLARALHEHKLGHAYLFVGAPGSGKGLAARALAQCVLCAQGGDAACDDCIRISRGTHPDVHVLTPASANGYLIEQIRQLIADVSLAPMGSTHKIYVIDRADLLRENSANALLKTIEEPPADTIFILSARSSSAVLPTIVSRCQVVALLLLKPLLCERFPPQSRKLVLRLQQQEPLVELWSFCSLLHAKISADSSLMFLVICSEMIRGMCLRLQKS